MKVNTLPGSLPKALPTSLLKVHIAFLVSNLIWGAAGPIIKYTLDFLQPATFIFLRFLFVALILLPYMILELKKHKVHKQDYLNLFLLGVFSQTAILITFYSLNYTTVLDNTLIMVLGSIVTIWAGHYFFKEEVDRKIEIGLILATIGTLLVVLEPLLSNGHSGIPVYERLFGNFLALVYALCTSVFVIWSKLSMGDRSYKLKRALRFVHIKPMKVEYPPTLIIGLSFYVGLITVIPFAFMEMLSSTGAQPVNLFDIDPRGLLGLGYMVIFSSIVAYMSHQWALKKGKVTDSVIWAYTGYIFTFPVAYLLLREVPNTFMLIGCAFIVAGVVIAESRNT